MQAQLVVLVVLVAVVLEQAFLLERQQSEGTELLTQAVVVVALQLLMLL
jgi:hypothetical protein